VKKDNEEYFLKEEPTKMYYTGKSKTFPSTIALNKLYYFMPYIKEKGVKDLYLIRLIRIGNKAEIYPETGDKEPRLVFELEYLKSLSDYEMVTLYRYWYKDTLLGQIFH
jgi:DNA (cytosine-5)-methyltransferase 1